MTVRSRNARGFRNPSSSSGVAFPPRSIRGILPHGSQRPGAALVPALRRRSSTPGGAEPRCRPRGIRMTENGRGTEPHRRIGLSERRPPGREGRGGRNSLASQADQTKAQRLGSASGGENRNGAPRRRTLSRPSPQAARPPRLTPAPAQSLDGRSDSPSRAVPMSWSSRARICAWADMVASGDGREAPHNSTVAAATAAAKDGPVGLKPARRFPAAGNAGRKFVNVVGGLAGKCSLEKPESLGGAVTNCPRG